MYIIIAPVCYAISQQTNISNPSFPQITKEDFLPKKVCERCISKIEQFFEWRTNSVQTDNIFKNYAESMRQVTATINFQVSYWVLYPESF